MPKGLHVPGGRGIARRPRWPRLISASGRRFSLGGNSGFFPEHGIPFVGFLLPEPMQNKGAYTLPATLLLGPLFFGVAGLVLAHLVNVVLIQHMPAARISSQESKDGGGGAFSWAEYWT